MAILKRNLVENGSLPVHMEGLSKQVQTNFHEIVVSSLELNASIRVNTA